jgi:hypothetical protein
MESKDWQARIRFSEQATSQLVLVATGLRHSRGTLVH